MTTPTDTPSATDGRRSAHGSPWPDRFADTEARAAANDEADAVAAGRDDGKRPLAVTRRPTVAMLDELGPEHPIGIVEIASALHVKRQTVDVWKMKPWFPPPSPTTLGASPFWFWSDVRAWAVETGRLVEQPPRGDSGGDSDVEVPRVRVGAPRHPRSSSADDAS